MESIAVLTVSAQEWNETKEMIKNISLLVTEMSNIPQKDLLTPKEVCAILKCGRSTFENLKGSGAFPVQRTPGTRKVYVLRSDLEKAISTGSI